MSKTKPSPRGKNQQTRENGTRGAKRPARPVADRPRREMAAPPAPDGNLICGKNAVLEALKSGRSVNRVWLAENLNSAFAAQVIEQCRGQGVLYQTVGKSRLAQLAGEDNRGVACELAAFNYQEVEAMLAVAEARGEAPLLLLLDGIEDPHNLGAVIRAALCAGAHGVVIPKRRAAALNATVVKTSAGAASHLPVARVANLVQTAEELKAQGLWLAAADMDGETAWQADLKGPLALVLGSEGKGISPLLKKHCDLTVALPLRGPLASLNVSAAAAALLYEIRRQRGSN